MKCQCEHIDHFEHDPESLYPKPHAYNAEVKEVITIGTDYGKFQICLDCEKKCFPEF